MLEQRKRFEELVEELVARFEGKINQREWFTRRYPKKLRDENQNIYQIPALYMQKGATNLLLDPIGYQMPGAEAAADIYLMPTYDPTATLYFEDGQWMIYYTFPDKPDDTKKLPLTGEAMNQVLDLIAEHAVPSV